MSMSHSDFSTVEKRIGFFNEVRDTPYFLDPLNRQRDRSCSSKADMLRRQLASLGMESRKIRCSFLWSQSALPDDIIAMAPKEETWHEFLEVKIPETQIWVGVDPTWDIGLRNAGFPVAEWDGLNSTILAVKPFKIYSPAESARRISINTISEECRQSSAFQRDVELICGPFVRRLNEWLQRQRSYTETLHA